MSRTDDYSDPTERIPTPNPTGFAPDVSPDQWIASLRAARIKLPPAWNQPFEVLQPAHLVGRARTNTTLVDPTIVQTDVLPPFAFAPFAEFDMQRAQNKRAVVSHHFQASGYGSTGIGTFIFSFTVQTLGETRFTFGSGPFGTLIAPGQVGIHDSSRTFTLTATLADLPADAEASIFLQQKDSRILRGQLPDRAFWASFRGRSLATSHLRRSHRRANRFRQNLRIRPMIHRARCEGEYNAPRQEPTRTGPSGSVLA